jgi:5'-3' exonuclease
MKLFQWDAESHDFLSSETRIQQFDFEGVAKAVRIRYNHLSCEVTPDECRLAYAAEFSEKFLPDMLSETSGLSIDDSMTFDEVMNVVERRNERNEMRKKKAFERILASLGPIVMSSNTESVELDMMKSNIAVKRMKEQNEQSKINEIATNRNEAARLENERKILRERLFIPAPEFRGKSRFNAL